MMDLKNAEKILSEADKVIAKFKDFKINYRVDSQGLYDDFHLHKQLINLEDIIKNRKSMLETVIKVVQFGGGENIKAIEAQIEPLETALEEYKEFMIKHKDKVTVVKPLWDTLMGT